MAGKKINVRYALFNFNSLLDNSNNIFVNGVNCYDLTDSIYVLDSFDGWDCSAYYLNEYFNVRVFIGNIQDTPATSHEFWIIDHLYRRMHGLRVVQSVVYIEFHYSCMSYVNLYGDDIRMIKSLNPND